MVENHNIVLFLGQHACQIVADFTGADDYDLQMNSVESVDIISKLRHELAELEISGLPESRAVGLNLVYVPPLISKITAKGINEHD